VVPQQGEAVRQHLHQPGVPVRLYFLRRQDDMDAQVRARSPENVVAEMQEVFDRFHIPNFFISDDLFTLNRSG